MQMDVGLDTGAMLSRESVAIGPTTTTAALHDVLADLGARMVLSVLDRPPVAVPQPADGVTYAAKLSRDDGRIDWTRDAAAIERQVRAYDPWPGTFTLCNGSVLKILSVAFAEGHGVPGTVLDDRLTIACGTGALRLTRVQIAGRSAMDADAFLRGNRVAIGPVLGA